MPRPTSFSVLRTEPLATYRRQDMPFDCPNCGCVVDGEVRPGVQCPDCGDERNAPYCHECGWEGERPRLYGPPPSAEDRKTFRKEINS